MCDDFATGAWGKSLSRNSQGLGRLAGSSSSQFAPINLDASPDPTHTQTIVTEESTMNTNVDCQEFVKPSQSQPHRSAPISSDISHLRKEKGKRKWI